MKQLEDKGASQRDVEKAAWRPQHARADHRLRAALRDYKRANLLWPTRTG